MKCSCFLIFVGLLAALAPGCARREVFPDRPILLVCPWSAGGGTDRVSRQAAALLEKELGVPVNVINATGGSGVTGHTRGARATPDGYTITMITVELNMLHWRGLTRISYQDFEPLTLLNQDDAALFVREDAPWKTPGDLLKAVHEKPRALKASGTAQGGIWHFSLAGWLDHAGLPTDGVLWVSINGAAPSLQELMSGGIDMVCCALPEAQALLDAKKIRCLGVMAKNRVGMYPDVPTFREQGQDWAMGGWRGLALPLGVPPERVQRLREALGKVIRGDEYLNAMHAAGFDTTSVEGDAFRVRLADLDRQFGSILTGDAFHSVRNSRFGPMTFPAVLGGLIGLTLLGLIAGGGLRTHSEAEAASRGGIARVSTAIGLILFYIAAAERLGYVLTAGLVLLVLMAALRVRWPVAVAVTLLVVPLSYQIFAVAMRVPLPRGLLGW